MRGPPTLLPRGFTLLEVLAVVALLSIAASICLASLGSAHESAAARALAASIRELDARGRLAARTLGAVDLVADRETSTVSTRLSATGEVLSSVDVGKERSVRLSDARANEILAVRLDRSGRSIDYSAQVVSSGGTTTLRFSGLTGLVEEVRR